MSGSGNIAMRGGGADGPVAQSFSIGFRLLEVVVAVLALVWLGGNIRQVPPDKQAVVLLFGEVVRVQPSGLVLAWPRPIETVELLPGPDQQLGLHIDAGTARVPGIIDPTDSNDTIPEEAGAYLTGDGGVILLDATLTWRIADARAYVLEAPHVAAALRRLFMAAATGVAASRRLDDFMSVTGGSLEGGPPDPPEQAREAANQAAREAVRGDLAREVNRRLLALRDSGTDLGVEVTRVDIAALLPPVAKLAFDSVLEAGQLAETGIASARTEAERTRQEGDRTRDRVIEEAHANAAERVDQAQAQVADVEQLTTQVDPVMRPSMLDQVYRARVSNVLRAAGGVSMVGKGDARVVLPGAADREGGQ
jgi:modulator of FtsH protease HflK